MQATFDAKIEKIENKKQALEELTILNTNLEFDWLKLNNVEKLKKLSLKNCIIDFQNFSRLFQKLKQIEDLEIDWYCFFFNLKLDKNYKLTTLNIKNFNYIFDKNHEINIYGTELKKNNFITFFPKFEKIFSNLETINIFNYEKKLINNNDFQQKNELLEGVTLYQLERCKKLKNINITNNDKELFNKEDFTNKIISFPNSKQILINHHKIQDLKKEIFNENVLCLDCDISKIHDEAISIEEDKESKNKFKKFNYFSLYRVDNLEKINAGSIEHLIINDLKRLIDAAEYEFLYLETLKDVVAKFVNLKTITFNLTDPDFSDEGDKYLNEIYEAERKIYFGEDKTIKNENFLWKFLKIKSELDRDDVKIIIKNCLKENLKDYKDIHFLIFQIFYHQKYNINHYYFENFDEKEVEDYFYDYCENKLENIIIIDENIKSKIVKQFEDIEILFCDQGDFYGYDIQIKGGLHSIVWDNNDSFSEMLELNKYFYDKNAFNQPANTWFFVKNSFLKKSKKKLFKNLKSISFMSFDHEEYFSSSDINESELDLPNAIHLDKIENLYVINGKKLNLHQLAKLPNIQKVFTSNGCLKKMNYRELPKLPKLNTLVIENQYSDGDGEIDRFSGFHNAPNLETIALTNLMPTSWETERWKSDDVNCEEFINLKKITGLILHDLTVNHLKKIKLPSQLQKISLIPVTIDAEHHSDDGTIDKKPTTEDYQFLNHCKKLTDLRIEFPSYNTYSQSPENYEKINFEKFFSNLSKEIKILELSIAFTEDVHKKIMEMINAIIKYCKKIETLKIDIKIKNDIEDRKKKKEFYCNYSKIKWKYGAKSPYDIELDFSIFNQLNHIKKLEFQYCNYNRTNIRFFPKNINNCLKNKQLEEIKIYPERDIQIQDLDIIFKSISTDEDRFFFEQNKKSKNKKVLNYSHQLTKKDQQQYDKLFKDKEEENEFELNFNNLDFIKYYFKRKFNKE